jgi:membrane protein required for colicin V production
MPSLSEFTSFDVIVCLVFLLFLVRGTWIGFMRQLAAFLALVGSYVIAGKYVGQIIPYVDDYITNPKLVFFISFFLLFITGALFFILLGKLMQKLMELTLLGWFDRLLGLLLGGVKGAIFSSLIFMVLVSSLSASNDLVKKSLTSPYLAQGAALLQQAINDPDLRKLFIPKEPAITDEQPERAVTDPEKDATKESPPQKKQADKV